MLGRKENRRIFVFLWCVKALIYWDLVDKIWYRSVESRTAFVCTTLFMSGRPALSSQPSFISPVMLSVCRPITLFFQKKVRTRAAIIQILHILYTVFEFSHREKLVAIGRRKLPVSVRADRWLREGRHRYLIRVDATRSRSPAGNIWLKHLPLFWARWGGTRMHGKLNPLEPFVEPFWPDRLVKISQSFSQSINKLENVAIANATGECRSKIGDFALTRSVWPKISGRRGRSHQSVLHG